MTNVLILELGAIMKIGEYIKAYRQHMLLTMQEFANEVGVTRQYISMLEKGVNPRNGEAIKPSLDTLKNIAKATNVSIDRLIEILDDEEVVSLVQIDEIYRMRPGIVTKDYIDEVNNEKTFYQKSERKNIIPKSQNNRINFVETQNTVTINVLGSIAAGIPISAQEDIIGTEEIPYEMARFGEFFGLRVVGDSMAPTIHSGDTVIIKRQSSVEDGEIGVVLIDGEDATLKRIHKSNDGLLLTGDNAAVYTPTFYSSSQVANLPVVILGKAVEIRRKL